MNSVAIITGASQGIGRSTSVRLARDFSAIVLTSRNARMHRSEWMAAK
jgi:3-oxoacyl-[acyl-carrier protein] reductase